MRRLRGDQGAAAHVYGLLAAGLAFLAMVAVLLLHAARPASDNAIGNPNREAGQELDAGLLAAILSSPGEGWAGGADGVSRLGLGAANGSGLDTLRLAALRDALLDSSAANGKVDYPDARSGLGLPAFEDFNLTVERLGAPGAGAAQPGPRTAYIGDWASLAAVTVGVGSADAMQASAQASLDLSMFSATVAERQALRQLGLTFNDRVFVSALAPAILVDLPVPLPDAPLLTYLNFPLLEGDVYPDVKAYLDANLVGRLGLYGVLVVGSGVDQSVLTPSATKNGIADWVQAGGRLVVLGSDAQNFQWLQPLFAVSTASVAGPVAAPDPSDSLLHVPYALDWASYDTHGLAWDIKSSGAGAHHTDFHHTLVQGGEDVLAWSKDAAFGSGSIVLTSIRPREMPAGEALRFLTNLLDPHEVVAYDLAYGPPPPAGTAVSAVERTTYAWDPAGGTVQLRVTVRVWNAP